MYRIFSQRIDQALGAKDIRHHRVASTEVPLRCLLSLDYLLDHTGLPWLPTEHEKVAALKRLASVRLPGYPFPAWAAIPGWTSWPSTIQGRNRTFAIGDEVRVKATFNYPVMVDTKSGRLGLKLRVNPGAAQFLSLRTCQPVCSPSLIPVRLMDPAADRLRCRLELSAQFLRCPPGPHQFHHPRPMLRRVRVLIPSHCGLLSPKFSGVHQIGATPQGPTPSHLQTLS